jgi:hypothetical protein
MVNPTQHARRHNPTSGPSPARDCVGQLLIDFIVYLRVDRPGARALAAKPKASSMRVANPLGAGCRLRNHEQRVVGGTPRACANSACVRPFRASSTRRATVSSLSVLVVESAVMVQILSGLREVVAHAFFVVRRRNRS